jgi:hypothetical protein
MPPRPARIPAAFLIFLAAFTALVVFLCFYYLLPAARASLEARKAGDKVGTHAISATSALLLSILLLILVAGILLTFRIGRYFFPGKTGPRTQTKYVDAWAESAKRLETPPDDEQPPLT